MKCTECGNAMTKSVGEHRYTESGLDNVILRNVTKHTCESCGAERVVIPAMAKLHRELAHAISEKPARLAPQEVAFLREHLELSNKEFAELMGVSPEQASRWTTTEAIGIPAEHLLRIFAAMGPESVRQRRSAEARKQYELASEQYAAAVEEQVRKPTEDKGRYEAIVEVLGHFPPRSEPVRDVPISISRVGAKGWTHGPN